MKEYDETPNARDRSRVKTTSSSMKTAPDAKRPVKSAIRVNASSGPGADAGGGPAGAVEAVFRAREEAARSATAATARSDAAASLIVAASPACSTSQKPVAAAPRTAPATLTA